MREGLRRERGRSAYRQGIWAETIALWWLRAKGYRLLGRRVRIGGGELDLIMRRGGLVVFVEVKFRPDRAMAAEAIGQAQLGRQRRAAAAWLGRRDDLGSCAFRFDAVLLSPGRLPRHVVSIFES